jgi:putative chitinase
VYIPKEGRYIYFYVDHIKYKEELKLSIEDLIYIMPTARTDDIKRYYEPLCQAMIEYKITSKNAIAAFIAQLAHESACFHYSEEIASGEAYNNRVDLGNHLGSNYGVKYKGRGLLQLTGFYNYKKYGEILGIDLVKNPKLASEPIYSTKIAALYWNTNNLTKIAEAGTLASFKAVTQVINGGYNGLASRISYWSKALTILK